MTIKYETNTSSISDNVYDCVVIGVYADSSNFTTTGKNINSQAHGYLNKLITSGDIDTELGKTTLLFEVPELPSKKVLLVGCGKKAELSPYKFQKILNAAAKALSNSKTHSAQYAVHEIELPEQTTAWKIQQSLLAIENSSYRFDEFKSTDKSKLSLVEVAFMVAKADKQLKQAINVATAISNGIKLCRDLGNTPSNVCTPSYLAEQAKHLAKKYTKVKTSVLNEAKMKKLGMNSLLAVGAGSEQESQLICMEYNGGRTTHKPIVLVGKGITYDSGGINIKLSMQVEMRYDMCGAAAVFGVIKAIAEAKLAINVVAVIAAAENMPSGSAQRPNDIVTSMSGKTIEILNTDAEGRLVLCDAITYSERFKPKVIIDVATLTGAMLVTLGHVATGIMANDQQLADELIAASKQSQDLAWQLPMFDAYQELLKSDYADIPNIGPKMQAGSITAACFLSRFTEKQRWAHLDVAGTASTASQGATGRPVALLVQYLLNQSS